MKRAKKQKRAMWITGLFAIFVIAALLLPNDEKSSQSTEGIAKEIAEFQEDAAADLEVTAKEAEAAEMETPVESRQTEDILPDSALEVHFMDMDQGDATLIKCDGFAMLIDAAEDSKGTAIQNYLNKQGVTKLDYLVLTHPDSDHIGGAPVIITKFEIDKVFVSDFEKDNRTYEKLIQALDNKNLKYEIPAVGGEYLLGGASFTILAPNKTYSDPNNASVALLLEHRDNTFLFTGDAEEDAEADILATGLNVKADVYKTGHHGSRTSSSQAFMDSVSPEYTVISCGEDNSYGHPHAQTLNTFRAMGIKVFRTDEQGSIVAASDGTSITWNCAPSDTWKAGEPTGSAENANTAQSSDLTADASIASGANLSSGVTPNSLVTETNPIDNGQQIQQSQQDNNSISYVLNSKTKKFHIPSCSYLPTTNRVDSDLSRDEIMGQGYDPCKRCNP